MNFEEHAAKRSCWRAGSRSARHWFEERGGSGQSRGARSALASSRRRCRPASAARPAASSWHTPAEAEQVAAQILGMTIGDYKVERLLIEEQAKIAREFYAAVLLDTAARKPLILFSTEGGMDIEEVADKTRTPSAACWSTSTPCRAPATSRPCSTASTSAPRIADRADHRSDVCRVPLARRRAAGDQSAGAAGRRPRGRARLQIRARRCRDLSPAGDRRRRRRRRHDRPESAAPRPASS